MAKVIAVCSSNSKGEKKHDIGTGMLVTDMGLEGDAHASPGNHRQLSLLNMHSIQKMRDLGAEVGPGDFAENLTIEGDLVLYQLPIGTRLKLGQDLLLEVTQIGKECHDHCIIFKTVGTCVMPVEGIFVRVIKGGRVQVGDAIEVIQNNVTSV